MSYYSNTTIAIHKDDYANIKKAIIEDASFLFETTEEMMSTLYFAEHPTLYNHSFYDENYLILSWNDCQWHHNPARIFDNFLADELVVTHELDFIQIGEDGRIEKSLSEHPRICTKMIVQEVEKEEF